MKVYRVVDKKELIKIINKKTNCLGTDSLKFSCFNTHKYRENEKYMHFFLNKKPINLLPKHNGQNYLCTFNIPFSLLLKHIGFGYYPSKNEKENRGYNSVELKVVEFAISASKFNPNWLVGVQKLETKNKNEI